MDDLLKAVKTDRNLPVRQLKQETIPIATEIRRSIPASSPEEALKILKDGPDINEVQGVLKFLLDTKHESFDVKAPSAIAAQIIQVLVSQIAPDFWTQLRDDRSLKATKRAFIDSIRSVSGLGAILSRLKLLVAATKNNPQAGDQYISPEQVRILIELIEELLDGDEFILKIWKGTLSSASTTATRHAIMWREFISLVATSRLLATVAEAEDILQKSQGKSVGSWVAKGSEYTRWLGRNIAHMVSTAKFDAVEEWTAAGGMCSKALVLGYTGRPLQCYFCLSLAHEVRYSCRTASPAATVKRRHSYAASKEARPNTPCS
jgi:telomere length regulation protein